MYHHNMLMTLGFTLHSVAGFARAGIVVKYVVTDEVRIAERLAGITLDALHNAHATGCVEFPKVKISHARVLLRAKNAMTMHITTLIDIDVVVIILVLQQNAPRNILRIGSQRYVLKPSE